MTPAIRLIDVAKTYRERGNRKEALKGISFEVPRGEICGFLGPNGAGKTTAMHILMDFIHPSAGHAQILGIDSRNPEARRAVGFLPEIFNFDGFLTGAEFLRLFGALGGSTRDKVAAAIPELLTFLEMPEAGSVRIRNYSKGMTQKIGLAQALIADPEVLILDEPTSGMDPIAKSRIKDLLIKLRAEGKTIFLSTHILSDVEDIADSIAIINQGQLLAFDRLANLLDSGTTSFKVVYRGGEPALAEHLGGLGEVTAEKDTTVVICKNRETKDSALSSILAAGADIVSLSPVRASLLGKFLELVQHQEVGRD
jgi:ABC-2 type transport system ATP-binding protein